MTTNEYVERNIWVKRERQEWPPAAKLILAFILGFVLLSPAILGLYWEVFLGS
jgi:hypothetical protein